MFKRQTTGSVVCVSCGYLVGVNDERCYHCGRRNPGLWGYAAAVRRLGNDLGFVQFVTITCVVCYVLTLLMSGGAAMDMSGGIMDLLAPSTGALLRFGMTGAAPVFVEGRWWTVLSAAWLHGSILHIGFNLLWIRQIAPSVAELYGAGRTVIIYTVASIVGFALTSCAAMVGSPVPFLHGAVYTIGASASIFGLFGALVYYGQRTGSNAVHSQAVYYAVAAFVLGLLFPMTDNVAHLGGFAGGYVAAIVLDPLKPERVNHMLGGLICLLLSVVSILASIVVPLGVFR